MEKYQNQSGDSGITAFEIGEHYIKVKFKKNLIYIYTYTKPGKQIVEKMKTLALKGKGLSTYIAQKVRENYDDKV